MKKFLNLLFFITIIFSLVACLKTDNQTESSLEDTTVSYHNGQIQRGSLQKIKDKGEIIVATSPDYPPYEFKIIEDGKEKIVGFDMEIAKEIAKDIGVDLRILELDFNGLLVSLNADKSDIILSGMTPNEERSESVDFSEIYYFAHQGVLVRKENKDNLNSIESLSGKKVGVQKGSIQETVATDQIPGAKIVSLTKIPNIILELKSGNIDVAILELPVADGYIRQYPNDLILSEAKIIDKTGGSAIAVKKGNIDLLEQLNKTIKRLNSEGLIDKFVTEANKIVNNVGK